MLVIDTSAWIEWFIDSPIGEILGGYLPLDDELIVPTIVQLELLKWLRREGNLAAGDGLLARTQMCVVKSLTPSIAVSAAEVSVNQKLATADAVIYATALENDAELLTCDAHFKDMPNVIYVPKIPRT
jgi:predicted nucleic acid-binding protein